MKNIKLTILQNILSLSISILFIRLIIKSGGFEMLGVWSLIGILQISFKLIEFGITPSMVYFIGKSNDNILRTKRYIQFSLKIYFILNILFIAIIYILYCTDLINNFKGYGLDINGSLLIYIILYLVISNFANFASVVMDGLNLVGKKTIPLILGSLILILSGYVTIEQLGIIGVLLSYTLQNLLLIIFFTIYTINSVHTNDSEYFAIDRIHYFKKLFDFYRLSIISIGYEPAIKFNILNFGSLEFLGYYESISKIFNSVRNLFAGAINVLVMQYFKLNKSLNLNPKSSDSIVVYRNSLIFSYSFILPLLYCYSIFIDLNLSLVPLSILFSLYMANSVNIASLPSYARMISLERMPFIIRNQYFLIFSLTFIAYFIGSFFGATGVIVWSMFSLAVSSYVNIVFESTLKITLGKFIDYLLNNCRYLLVNGVASFLYIHSLINFNDNNIYILFVTLLYIFFNIIISDFLAHLIGKYYVRS